MRWLYRHIRSEELTRTFVHDMATNHLPHIYELLEMLCDEEGIKRNPLPPIRWLDLNHRPPPSPVLCGSPRLHGARVFVSVRCASALARHRIRYGIGEPVRLLKEWLMSAALENL